MESTGNSFKKYQYKSQESLSESEFHNKSQSIDDSKKTEFDSLSQSYYIEKSLTAIFKIYNNLKESFNNHIISSCKELHSIENKFGVKENTLKDQKNIIFNSRIFNSDVKESHINNSQIMDSEISKSTIGFFENDLILLREKLLSPAFETKKFCGTPSYKDNISLSQQPLTATS